MSQHLAAGGIKMQICWPDSSPVVLSTPQLQQMWGCGFKFNATKLSRLSRRVISASGRKSLGKAFEKTERPVRAEGQFAISLLEGGATSALGSQSA